MRYLTHLFIFLFLLELSTLSYAQEPQKKVPIEKRVAGDIYLGFQLMGGLGITNSQFTATNTTFKNKDHFYYGIGFVGEFFFTPYVSLIFGTATEFFTFSRYKRYVNGETIDKKTTSYSQWFHQMQLTSRFYYWDELYFQTGFILLIHYGSKFFAGFSGVDNEINTKTGASWKWQVGLGYSIAVGKNNSNVFDIGLNFYVPIIGSLINNLAEDAGGTKIRLKSDSIFAEIFISTTFKI